VSYSWSAEERFVASSVATTVLADGTGPVQAPASESSHLSAQVNVTSQRHVRLGTKILLTIQRLLRTPGYTDKCMIQNGYILEVFIQTNFGHFGRFLFK
jgi:hypothetical protein